MFNHQGAHSARINKGVPINSILWYLPKEVSKNLIKKSEKLLNPGVELHSSRIGNSYISSLTP